MTKTETEIYYFIHLTGRDLGNTGIQRVVRNLGRVLQGMPGVRLTPVRWCARQSAIVLAGPEFIDVISLYGGPKFHRSEREDTPIHEAAPTGSWVLIPEVPHLGSADSRYPSVDLPIVLGYARERGFRVAAVFHDLLPLTHPDANRSDEIERLRFTIYGQALVNVDLVLPVSRATGNSLMEWWRRSGFRDPQLPKLLTVPLPEEMAGQPRGLPNPARPPASGGDETNPEFIAIGTVFRRKNQIRAIEAFNAFCEAHPDTNATFSIAGHVAPDIAGALARRVARSKGRVRMLGYVSDAAAVEMIQRSRATVFVSLAEGFGLPVAESLWLGKPCLCSNTGSVAEIALGGGCLLVDPMDIDAIREGFERLCYDERYYLALVDQVKARTLRTWQDYGARVLATLRAAP
jgi:glycosyltransferase involved in cell wall biosynthesis